SALIPRSVSNAARQAAVDVECVRRLVTRASPLDEIGFNQARSRTAARPAPVPGRRGGCSGYFAQAQSRQAWQYLGAKIRQLVEIVDEGHRNPGEPGGRELRHLPCNGVVLAAGGQPDRAG